MTSYKHAIPIKHWAEADRPREKLQKMGKHALSNSELLAILLGSGSSSMSAVELARRILARYNQDVSELARANITQLTTFKGVGKAKAVSVIAAFELGRRLHLAKPGERAIIRSSRDAFQVINKHLSDQLHEEFWVILLNRRNAVIGCERISVGGTSATVVDAKIIFNRAVSVQASGIILCHNHPSGQMRPSEADIMLTRKIRRAGNLMDVSVLDHLIVHRTQFYSFADEGLFENSSPNS